MSTTISISGKTLLNKGVTYCTSLFDFTVGKIHDAASFHLLCNKALFECGGVC